jgi:BolA protein
MAVREQIIESLAPLKPLEIEIQDLSDHHQGHAGHDGRGESHFSLRIISPEFINKTAVERHRMVYSCLNILLKNRIHALKIKALAPNEVDIKSYHK